TAGESADDEDDVIDLGQDDSQDKTVVAGMAASGAAAAAARDSEGDDAIAEADIYIAYGRLDQAARLLESALEETPDRVDARLKLLEVYAQAGNVGAFEQHFAALEASGDDDAVQKAIQMRADMPEASLDAEEESELSLDDLETQLLSGKSSFERRPEPEEVEDQEFLLA